MVDVIQKTNKTKQKAAIAYGGWNLKKKKKELFSGKVNSLAIDIV